MISILHISNFIDRFPTAHERDYLSDYAFSIRNRLAAAQDITANEHKIVESTLERIKILYPNFLKYHAVGWDKGYRDIQLLLQYMVKSMYLNDIKYYDDTVLIWVRTLFKSFNFTPKFMRDSYTILRDNTKALVKPRTFSLIEPYLNHTIQFLSDIPEPVRPEV